MLTGVSTRTLLNNITNTNFHVIEYKYKHFQSTYISSQLPCVCWQSCELKLYNVQLCTETVQCTSSWVLQQYIKVQSRAGWGGVSPYYALPSDISPWIGSPSYSTSWEPCKPSELSMSWTQPENLFLRYSLFTSVSPFSKHFQRIFMSCISWTQPRAMSFLVLMSRTPENL